MEKKKIYHDFYLCEIEPELGSGYMVKHVNKEGKTILEHFISFEDIDWFREDKDFVIVSRSEWDETGTGDESP